jgi:hypothetical protein
MDVPPPKKTYTAELILVLFGHQDKAKNHIAAISIFPMHNKLGTCSLCYPHPPLQLQSAS